MFLIYYIRHSQIKLWNYFFCFIAILYFYCDLLYIIWNIDIIHTLVPYRIFSFTIICIYFYWISYFNWTILISFINKHSSHNIYTYKINSMHWSKNICFNNWLAPSYFFVFFICLYLLYLFFIYYISFIISKHNFF